MPYFNSYCSGNYVSALNNVFDQNTFYYTFSNAQIFDPNLGSSKLAHLKPGVLLGSATNFIRHIQN